jgi:hypothetical protein
MDKHELKIIYMDEGFCRIYYKVKSEKVNILYCLQDEGRKVVFYRCSEDGEPAFEAKTKGFNFEIPLGDSELVKNVRKFIKGCE